MRVSQLMQPPGPIVRKNCPGVYFYLALCKQLFDVQLPSICLHDLHPFVTMLLGYHHVLQQHRTWLRWVLNLCIYHKVYKLLVADLNVNSKHQSTFALWA